MGVKAFLTEAYSLPLPITVVRLTFLLAYICNCSCFNCDIFYVIFTSMFKEQGNVFKQVWLI